VWQEIRNFLVDFEKCSKIEESAEYLAIDGICFNKQVDEFKEVCGSPEFCPQKNRGYIFRSLTIEQRRWLERSRVSYIAMNGHMRLFLANRVMTIKPSKSVEEDDHDAIPYIPYRENSPIRASQLISPNGLKVADGIFRLSNDELKNLSGRKFSDVFQVPQSSVSKLLTNFNCSDLPQFKAYLQKWPLARWKEALDNKKALLKMRPYSSLSTNYQVIGQFDTGFGSGFLEGLIKKYDGQIFPGPLELAKLYGVIRDPTIYIWGDQNGINDIKREFRLVPAKNRGMAQISLAPIHHGFIKDAVTTQWIGTVSSRLPVHFQKINIFRAVWDLGFEDARTKSIQLELFKEVLHDYR